MFHLYKNIHINLPKQSQKKISALSVKTLASSLIVIGIWKAGPENPNRTPSSSHPIPNAAQAPVSH